MSLDSVKIKRFLSRLIIYQYVLLWPYMKINDLERHSVDFRHKVLENFLYFGIQNKTVNEYLNDPNLLLAICSVEILAGIFAIFGSFYGNLLSAVLFSMNCLIYFNPLFPENTISLYDTRSEVFYNIGILITILLCTFYNYESKNEKVRKVQDIIDASENDEYVEQKFKKGNFQNKPSNKKGKNKKK